MCSGSSGGMATLWWKGNRPPNCLQGWPRGDCGKRWGALQLALEGHITDHRRFQLNFLLEFVQFGERQLCQLEGEIRRLITQVEPTPAQPEDGAIAELA